MKQNCIPDMFSGTKIGTCVFLQSSPFLIHLKYENWFAFFYLFLFSIYYL